MKNPNGQKRGEITNAVDTQTHSVERAAAAAKHLPRPSVAGRRLCATARVPRGAGRDSREDRQGRAARRPSFRAPRKEVHQPALLRPRPRRRRLPDQEALLLEGARGHRRGVLPHRPARQRRRAIAIDILRRRAGRGRRWNGRDDRRLRAPRRGPRRRRRRRHRRHLPRRRPVPQCAPGVMGCPRDVVAVRGILTDMGQKQRQET